MTLPASFTANTIERIYSFLATSNAIEHINEIDYSKSKFHKIAKGHFGALVDSQLAAEKGNPLTKKIICSWQSLITTEQRPFGYHITEEEIGHIRNSNLPKNVRVGDHVAPPYNDVPVLLQNLIEDINEGLKNKDKLRNDKEYCMFLGTIFHEFMRIHPFADGNGRTGRLIANYVATSLGRPLIIIDPEFEREEYYKAHKSPSDMVRFMAKKTTEAIFGTTGQLLVKDETSSGWSCLYKPLDEGSAEKETVEWHSIAKLLKSDVPTKEEAKNSKSDVPTKEEAKHSKSGVRTKEKEEKKNNPYP